MVAVGSRTHFGIEYDLPDITDVFKKAEKYNSIPKENKEKLYTFAITS